jgi:Tfp pilus assembly protein PilV
MLIEAALTTIIIGVGVVALVQLLAVGTKNNDTSAQMTTAVNLINNIHEIMAGMPLYDPSYPTTWNAHLSSVANFAGITEFDGATFSPPLDNTRASMSGYGAWSESITVQSLNEDNLATTVTDSTTQNAARVTVTVSQNGSQVYEASWVAAATVGG